MRKSFKKQRKRRTQGTDICGSFTERGNSQTVYHNVKTLAKPKKVKNGPLVFPKDPTDEQISQFNKKSRNEWRKLHTNHSYHDSFLHKHESKGYMAAGLMVYRVNHDLELEIVVILEQRSNNAAGPEGAVLNLPGGKRDYDDPSARITAVREFVEEVTPDAGLDIAQISSMLEMQFIYWCKTGKYVLHITPLHDVLKPHIIPGKAASSSNLNVTKCVAWTPLLSFLKRKKLSLNIGSGLVEQDQKTFSACRFLRSVIKEPSFRNCIHTLHQATVGGSKLRKGKKLESPKDKKPRVDNRTATVLSTITASHIPIINTRQPVGFEDKLKAAGLHKLKDGNKVRLEILKRKTKAATGKPDWPQEAHLDRLASFSIDDSRFNAVLQSSSPLPAQGHIHGSPWTVHKSLPEAKWTVAATSGSAVSHQTKKFQQAMWTPNQKSMWTKTSQPPMAMPAGDDAVANTVPKRNKSRKKNGRSMFDRDTKVPPPNSAFLVQQCW